MKVQHEKKKEKMREYYKNMKEAEPAIYEKIKNISELILGNL